MYLVQVPRWHTNPDPSLSLEGRDNELMLMETAYGCIQTETWLYDLHILCFMRTLWACGSVLHHGPQQQCARPILLSHTASMQTTSNPHSATPPAPQVRDIQLSTASWVSAHPKLLRHVVTLPDIDPSQRRTMAQGEHVRCAACIRGTERVQVQLVLSGEEVSLQYIHFCRWWWHHDTRWYADV